MKLRTIHPIAQVNAKINRSPPNATLANAIGLPSIPSFRVLIIQPIIQMTAINFVIRRAPSKTLITIAYSLACKSVHIVAHDIVSGCHYPTSSLRYLEGVLQLPNLK